MSADRCPTCDREKCAVSALQAVVEAGEANNPSDVDAFILASATCDAHAVDWRAEAMALRAEVAALKARPLTVASALALPEVQSGACVVETPATDERCAEQLRLRKSGRLSSREYDRGRWGDWFASSDLSTAPKPCRLVPLADADLDPATRGPMP